MDIPWRHEPRRRARGVAGRAWGAGLSLAAALCLAPDWAGAQIRQPPLKAPAPAFGWCQFADIAARSLYYSRVFAAAPGAPADAANSAFLAYLKQKYSLSGVSVERAAAVCQWRPNVSPYFVGRAQESDKSAAILRNQRIVDTDWAPH